MEMKAVFRLTHLFHMAGNQKTNTSNRTADAVVPKKSQRLNVFGLLSKANDIQAYSTTDTMNGDLIIAFIDDFVKNITQKTVIVLMGTPSQCNYSSF